MTNAQPEHGELHVELSIEQWIKIGISLGFCGPPVCYTHDGLPTSAEEDAAYENGNDDCLHVIRLYADEQHKKSIEDNHSPSQWRNYYGEEPSN